MAKSKSPFKENKELNNDIQKFLNKHRATFNQHVDRTSTYFELAVYNDIVQFYENNNYLSGWATPLARVSCNTSFRSVIT